MLISIWLITRWTYGTCSTESVAVKGRIVELGVVKRRVIELRFIELRVVKVRHLCGKARMLQLFGVLHLQRLETREGGRRKKTDMKYGSSMKREPQPLRRDREKMKIKRRGRDRDSLVGGAAPR